jgi:LPS-assembly protein
LRLNAAAYRVDQPLVDGRRRAARVIPTGSIDAGLAFERDSTWFGREFLQTLEPRVRYLNTPLRDQSVLPNFDAAANDFNIVSIYGDNAFTGIDRVSDAHQVTAGATSRWLDRTSGEEKLRMGAVQRYLLRDQIITPDGVPVTQRFSDVLLFGQSNISPRWTLAGAVQFSPETDRATRSVLSARYSAGPFRNLGLGYRFVRGASEQVDIGWQWPLYRRVVSRDEPSARATPEGCGGTLYGVGRVNYSQRDRRVTDSIVGLEYDAGCWIGRLVAERLSTGRSEATTRLLLQLELVGLSRLGSNPLRVLKQNVPGYTLLRDEARPIPPPPVYE